MGKSPKGRYPFIPSGPTPTLIVQFVSPGDGWGTAVIASLRQAGRMVWCDAIFTPGTVEEAEAALKEAIR